MGQTKKQSLIETIVNVFSGMLISFSISQLAHVLAWYTGWFTWDISVSSNICMTIVLTVVSIGRSYGWRRYFNGRTHNGL